MLRLAAILALSSLGDSARFHSDKPGVMGSITFTGIIEAHGSASLIVSDEGVATYCEDSKCRPLESGNAFASVMISSQERLAAR